MRGFREFCGNFRRLRGRSPTRRLAAVTPGPRPIESMYAELVHLLHFIDPGRAHPIGVIVRRLGDFRQPKLAVEHCLCDFPGALPHVGFAHDVGIIIASEGELTRKVATPAYVDTAPTA